MTALALLLGCSGDDDGKTRADPVDTDVSETTPPLDTETTPAPTGDTAPDTDVPCPAPADAAGFRVAFEEKFCFGWERCNTSNRPCEPGGTTTGPPGPCEFDPIAAEACVCTDEWRCNSDFPGLEYVIPPESCARVCGS